MYSIKEITIAFLGLFLALGVFNTQAQQTAKDKSLEYEIDGMTFGMPEAEVFTEDYDGPPVVGEYVTMLPNLKPLDYEGNKHHEVRIDIIAQEIEVAEGVR